MRRFRSLLIDQADLRMPGLHIKTFALHRHLAEHASIEPHRHPWSQAILYLGGSGTQTIARGTAHVAPGTLVVLPPGVAHAFQRTDLRAPLCLMIDFRLPHARRRPPAVCSLTRSELAFVRQQMATLLSLQTGAGQALRWEGAAAVLQILTTLLRSAGWLERIAIGPRPDRRHGGAIQRLLEQVTFDHPLADIVRRSGYQRDHLNRLIKQETGLTLGQYRAQKRLARAKALLEQGVQVAAVGATVGMPDQSYFARWFRRQTGQPPSHWTRRRLG